MSDLPSGLSGEGARTGVRVQVTFHTSGERQAQTVASKLIDRAHEIANLPECECDVDVSVETPPTDGSASSSSANGAPLRSQSSKS